MEQKVVIVNEKDQKIRLEDKSKAHEGEGMLHRAISTFLFNEKGELLITKRSQYKKLWPGFWDATCCTHPMENETYIQSGERRLPQELGISCKLEYLTKFKYLAHYKNIGSENEMCALLIGKCGKININPNPQEIEDFKWISIKELEKDIEGEPDKYTPWLKIALQEYSKINK